MSPLSLQEFVAVITRELPDLVVDAHGQSDRLFQSHRSCCTTSSYHRAVPVVDSFRQLVALGQSPGPNNLPRGYDRHDLRRCKLQAILLGPGAGGVASDQELDPRSDRVARLRSWCLSAISSVRASAHIMMASAVL